MTKRMVGIGIILIAIYLAMGGVALAGYPHGEFADNTDACAACHRAHTAISAYLLADTSGNALCKTCHADGMGADTDVMNGVYLAGGEPDNTWGEDGGILLGGGFDHLGGSSDATSQHNLGQSLMTPGEDTNAAMVIECMSCHTPHMNQANQHQYRLLRLRPNGVAPIEIPWNGPWTNETQTVKATTNGGNRAYTEKDFDPTTPGVQNYTNNYKDNLDEWCIACHTRYKIRGDAPATSGSTLTAGTILRAGATATSSIDTGEIGGSWTTSAPYILSYDWTLTDDVTLVGTVNRLTGDTYDAGDIYGTVPRFRHATDLPIQGMVDPFNGLSYNMTTDLPLEDATGNGRTYIDDKMTCITCHRSHGTDAKMEGFADFAHSLYGGDRGSLPTNSMHLRQDNRGVCIKCHTMGTL